MSLSLATAYIKVRIDATGIHADLSKVKSTTEFSLKSIAGSIKSMLSAAFSPLTSMQAQLAGLLTGFGMGVLVKNAFELASNFERTEVALKAMTKSGSMTKQLLSDIQAYSRKSPFSYLDLQKNAQLLLAYGLQSDELIATLKNLSDVTAGTGGQFSLLALAYGQVRAKGRLFAQEIRQFTENGITLLEVLAQNLGKTTAEVL
jgi:tape measure domain-containing protein